MEVNMQQVRRSNERGTFDFGWLQTAHSFSFGEYYDPQWMNFRALRVLNEDHIAPGRGFPMHPHRDAEIISVVMAGELTHEDSMGNRGTIKAHEVQYMSAGRGVTHSEYNASADTPVHLIQIWLKPREKGATPRYEHRSLAGNTGGSQLLVSGDEADGVITIRQDAQIHQITLAPGQELRHETKHDRHLWLQIVSGAAQAEGHLLHAGDALAAGGVDRFQISAGESELKALLFDLG